MGWSVQRTERGPFESPEGGELVYLPPLIVNLTLLQHLLDEVRKTYDPDRVDVGIHDGSTWERRADVAEELRTWPKPALRAVLLGVHSDPTGLTVMLLSGGIDTLHGSGGNVGYYGQPQLRRKALELADLIYTEAKPARRHWRTKKWPEVIETVSDQEERQWKEQRAIHVRAATYGAAAGAITGFIAGAIPGLP